MNCMAHPQSCLSRRFYALPIAGVNAGVMGAAAPGFTAAPDPAAVPQRLIDETLQSAGLHFLGINGPALSKLTPVICAEADATRCDVM
jgi:hypothetical protein